ncbi:hypothetical protein FOE67_21340 [Streptomyces calidiresistens]|uniref:Barstar (barnase inhibitor) domain-containing protein n=1 Tax=Streptomyces calidiresistens TaxID=1485586 RepID=A0A7W3T781_9ACTN|nr:hypothetical protein [Streptomyces calidiresistens]
MPFSPPDGPAAEGENDGGGIKRLLIEEFAATFDFPTGTGRNWDALADLLTDLSWLPPARGRLMVAPHWSAWRARDTEAVDTAEEILREAVVHWSTRPVPLAVLLG